MSNFDVAMFTGGFLGLLFGIPIGVLWMWYLKANNQKDVKCD